MGKEIVSRTTFVKGVTACVVVAASLGVITIGDYSVNSSEEAATATTASSGTMSYTAGTYTASSAGISSDVTVTATFDESSLTDVSVDVSGETAGIGADIGDEMVEKFLAAQSADVDGVSSATVTSDALKAAMQDCITQAAGGGASDDAKDLENETESAAAEVETEASVTEAETEAAKDETENETDAEAAEAESEAETAAEAEADAAEAETKAETADTSSGTASYTAGTYTATSAGIDSDVTVYATFSESGLTALSVDVSGETAGLGADIGDEMIEQFLNAQSADVDGVSGATVTSDALKAALQDCFDQAAGNGTPEDGVSAVSEEDTADEAEAAETETETEAETAAEEETETEIANAETETETEAVAAETEAETDAAEMEAESEAAADAKAAAYKAGTYAASAAGIDSDVTVIATFSESRLTAVSVDVSGETAGIGADIGDEMAVQFLTAQSAEVDGVSGATVTSDALKTAMQDCIAQAAATESSDEGTSPVSENEAETEAETEAADADTAASSPLYTAGTYTANATGYSAEITVTMEFDEYSILAMDADVAGETSTYALIDSDVIGQVLDAQSAEVDGISGATVTADAILEAAEDCIAQALIAEEDAEGSSAIIGGADTPTEIYITDNESDEKDTEDAAEEEADADESEID
ncbi:MAG: FMN-binding protein [Clostridiales bacterium]|nr:FMN-binding protein [Clostridiales bacterium]